MEKLNKEQILDWYTQDILMDSRPKSVYAFAKKHSFEESEFYQHFGNLESIESFFFEEIINATHKTVHSSQEFADYTSKEKWLSFYYTLFENLKMNRSFVQESLGNSTLRDLKKLKNMRAEFFDFVRTSGLNKHDFKQQNINKVQDKVLEESAWLHLLGSIRFWLNDTSPGFEKTDIFIEKSVNAGFELTNFSAFKNVADFGKFIGKDIFNI